MFKIRKNPNLLRGGAKNRELAEITPVEIIATGSTEADVSKVKVNLAGKRFEMVEKRFKTDYLSPIDSRENPVLHQRIFQELRRLDKEHELGLRLPGSVRLRDAGEKKPRIVTTLYDSPPTLDHYDRGIFVADCERQQKLAREHQWIIGIDNFIPARTKDGVVAVIGDFGGIVPPSDVLKRIRSDRSVKSV